VIPLRYDVDGVKCDCNFSRGGSHPWLRRLPKQSLCQLSACLGEKHRKVLSGKDLRR